jgi:hypothetical protein
MYIHKRLSDQFMQIYEHMCIYICIYIYYAGVGRVGSTVENIEQRLLEATSDQNMKMDMLMTAIHEVASFIFVDCVTVYQ